MGSLYSGNGRIADRYGDVCLCQVGGDLEVDFRIQLNQLVGVRQPEADVALDDDVDERGPYPCGLWPFLSEIDLQGRGWHLTC